MDFDIDKAYTLMYALDKNGKIAGNVFTNYDSIEHILESFILPKSKENVYKTTNLYRILLNLHLKDDQIPAELLGIDITNEKAVQEFWNSKYNEKIIKGKKVRQLSKELINILNALKLFTGKLIALEDKLSIPEFLKIVNKYATYYGKIPSTVTWDGKLDTLLTAIHLIKNIDGELDPILLYKCLAEIINFIQGDGSEVIYYTSDLDSDFVNRIINYIQGHESPAALQNRVTYIIRKASSDLANLRSGEVPMSMDPAIEPIDKHSNIASVVNSVNDLVLEVKYLLMRLTKLDNKQKADILEEIDKAVAKFQTSSYKLAELLEKAKFPNLEEAIDKTSVPHDINFEKLFQLLTSLDSKETSKFKDMFFEAFDYLSDSDNQYSDLDPYTLWKIQKENAVGKTDVGIAANGIKAAGSLQLYMNVEDERLYTEYKKLIEQGHSKELAFEWLQALFDTTNKNRVTRSLNLNWKFSTRKRWASITATSKSTRPICTELIYHLANCKSSYEVFKARLLKGLGIKSISSHYLWDIFKKIAEPKTRKEKEFAKACSLGYNEKNENTGAYMIDSSLAPEELFILALYYYHMHNEDNVADNISMFISLATDNAKTLKLSKMYGTSELLSIPLTLITLGVDLDNVIDICNNCLVVIAEDLDRNRFMDLGHMSTDVLKLWQNHNDEFDGDTFRSISEAIQVSKEFRSLTEFFKVNQGVTTRYTELSQFLHSLSSYKEGMAKIKGQKKSEFNIEGKTILGHYGSRIPFIDIFSHGDIIKEKQALLEYEELKTGFNVLDVVMNTPHFRALLESIAICVDVTERMSGISHLVSRVMHTPEEDTTHKLEIPKSKAAELNYSKRLIYLLNEKIIGDGLEKMTSVEFAKMDIMRVFGEYPSTLADETRIGVSSEAKIDAFLEAFEEAILPHLQLRFKDNFFLKFFTELYDKGTKRKYYNLEFLSHDAKRDSDIAENIDLAQIAYQEFADISSGLKTADGYDLTFGDLFYLYNMITTRNQIKSGTSCIYEYAVKHKVGSRTLPSYIDEEFNKLDIAALNQDDSEQAKYLNDIYELVFPYIACFTEAENGRNASKEVNKMQYSIGTSFIRPMHKPQLLSKISIYGDSNNSIIGKIKELLTIDGDKVSADITSNNDLIITYDDPIYPHQDIWHLDGLLDFRDSGDVLHGLMLERTTAEKIIYDFVGGVKSLGVRLSLLTNGDDSRIIRNQSIIDIIGAKSDLVNRLKNLINPDVKVKDKVSLFLTTELSKFLTDSKSVIIYDPTANLMHVLYVGNSPILVINPDFMTFATDAELKMAIMNSYIESLDNSNISVTARLMFSINLILPKTKLAHNVTELNNALKEHLDLISSTKSTILKDYIALLSEIDYADIKKRCKYTLAKYQTALQYLSVYYSSAVNEDEEKEGDIYEHINVAEEIILEYLPERLSIKAIKHARNHYENIATLNYAKLKTGKEDVSDPEVQAAILEFKEALQNVLHYTIEFNGKTYDKEGSLYVRLADLDTGKIIYCKFNVFSSGEKILHQTFKIDDNFKRTKSLKISNRYTLANLNFADLKYNDQEISIEQNSIFTIGDKIILSGKTYILQDIIINKSGNHEYVLHDTDTHTLVAKTLDLLQNGKQIKVNKGISRTNTMQIPLNTNQFIISELKNKELKETIFKNLLPGDVVVTSSDSSYYFRSYGGNFISCTDSTNKLFTISIDEIKAVHMSRNLPIDSEFDIITTPKTIIVEDYGESNDNLLEVALYMPELRDGYIVFDAPIIEEHDVIGVKHIISPAYAYLLSADQILISPKYNFSDSEYIGSVNNLGGLKVGDYIVNVIKPDQKSTNLQVITETRIYKILDINYETGTMTYLVTSDLVEFTSYGYGKYKTSTTEVKSGIKFADIFSGSGMTRVYRKNTEFPVYTKSVKTGQVNKYLSDHSVGNLILEKLQSKFGAPIEIITDSDASWFARVSNGVIQINQDRYELYKQNTGKDISLEAYIATKAAHEFTHLIMAYLRAKDPDAYMAIIDAVRQKINVNAEITGSDYKNDILKSEEYIVRKLEELLSEELSKIDSSIVLPDISRLIINGFHLLFDGSKPTIVNLNNVITACLPYNFFSSKENMNEFMDIHKIRDNYISDKILEAIKCD